jgi:PAS domain S-box-containing protein
MANLRYHSPKNTIRTLFTLILLSFLFSQIAYAQRLSFRRYSVKEGLSQSQIFDIVQDKRGYIWFATAEGLNRFDGKQFVQYTKRDGLAGTFISKMYLDSHGILWLGHRAMGISKFRPENNTFEQPNLPDDYQYATISDIIEDSQGVIWFSTEKNGLLKYENNQWQIFRKQNGLPTESVDALCWTGEDLWIGSDRGILVYNASLSEENRFKYLSGKKEITFKNVSAFLKDIDGNIWIGDTKKGIYKFIPSDDSEIQGEFINISKSYKLPSKNIQCIFKDIENNIWIGTKYRGIIRYVPPTLTSNEGQFIIIDASNGLDKENVASIFQDREGSFWIGTDGGGVFQYRGECFEQYGRREGLIDNVIWAILEDNKGGYWFGSEKGLTYFTDGLDTSPKYYTSRDWGGEDMVMDIHEDSRGYLWLCINGTGPREYNSESKTFRGIEGLDDKNIISVEEDNHGNMWFGSFSNGVFRLDPKTDVVTNFKKEDGLGSNTIFTILKTRDDHLWFATSLAGVTRYDGENFKNYGVNQGLDAISVLSIAEGNDGTIWIGSEGDGLFKYDGKNFENYSKKTGVWKDDIYSLICDKQDNVWIGTRQGIERINPSTGHTKKYGEFEGFSAIETNQNAVYKDSNGHILFGTINGLIKYNPSQDRPNTVSPLTYINNVRVYFENHPIPENHIYSYKDNYLTFSFDGLSFVAPEKVKFSYMLEGVDQDWSPKTMERYATYANLSPGDYSFQVRAMNSDHIWTEKPASFNFTISAPIWLRGWFYLIIAFAIGASIYATHHYRVRKINRNNLLLEELVHSRTKDLLEQKDKTQAAYDALLESENKLKQVTRSVDAYFWTTAVREGNKLDYVFITDTYYEICGYSRDDFPKAESKFEQIMKIVHPDDQKIVKTAMAKVLKGIRINLTYRIRRKNGEIRWIYDNAISVKNDQGIIDTIHGVGIDITNRKLTEEALKKSEEKYETFIRYSTEAIWCMDLKKPLSTKLSVEKQVEHIMKYAYISDSNDAMAYVYGFDSSKEIIGVKLSNGLIRDIEENKNQLKNFIESGYRLKNAEFYELDKKGKTRTFLVSFVGIVENNMLVRGWGMQQDITEKKEAELALKDSEEIYRRLIERSPDAIIVHSEGIIDYVNQAAITIYGAKVAADLLGRPLTDLAHPDFIEIGKKRVEKIYREKREVGLMVQKMVRLDGTEFDVEVMGAPTIFRGKASGQSIIRDITEKKKMELELQKAQKLESVGLLAGGIAHDFNNILTAILGNISLGKLYSKADDPTYSVLSEAEKATLQAKDLTHQLLTFSKGGAPVKKTASIFDIVKDSASFVLRGSKITCEYFYPSDIWAVEVDVAQISQVIQNLIINAEQAMPEGKRITVNLENIRLPKDLLYSLKPGKFVKIVISDEGIGIPKDHINKIFDPYFTTKQKGSGLGLATSYSIIRRHEGHIQVKSKIGVGTDVEIFIPASENHILNKDQQNVSIEGGDGRILVMDDEEMVRELSIHFLSHLGYEVEAVPDGESAVSSYKQSLIENNPFKLVVMDLTIPGGMGGKEAIQKLKEIDPNVKAIVSSGYSNDPVLANFKKFGFSAVLAKPYKIETLSTIISQVINGKNKAIAAIS